MIRNAWSCFGRVWSGRVALALAALLVGTGCANSPSTETDIPPGGAQDGGGDAGGGGASDAPVSESSPDGGDETGQPDASIGDGQADVVVLPDSATSDVCVPAMEVCDGIDNDCNGLVDEGDPGGGKPCKVPGKLGVCESGENHCQKGQIKCIQIVPSAPEVCDGKDNDCNGTVDDNLTDTGASCNSGLQGVCAAGTEQCVNHQIVCVQNVQPSQEVCDGKDNDCNGTVDDGMPGAGQPCKLSEPSLKGTPCENGQTNCLGGANNCSQTVFPSAEICDGKDNDCNGTVDDASALNGKPCTTTYPGVCIPGKTNCTNGVLSCIPDIAPGTLVETCDGKDNDCNGTVDDVADPTVDCVPKNPSAQNVQSWKCSGGVCKVDKCMGSYLDCDSYSPNGCETDTLTNVSNCGTCGRSCSAAHALVACVGGSCELACSNLWGNCDANWANGCELDLRSDVNNCGACGRHCESTTGTPACNNGVCSITCLAGLADCDGNVANGCEVNLKTDPANCNACGKVCSTVGGAASCNSGSCGISCYPGLGDCNGDVTDGCEADLNNDPLHCATCPVKCSSTHGTALCSAGVCGITCTPGYANCDGNVSNGCEIDLNNDRFNCNGCGNACSSSGGTASCSGGNCYITCSPGYADCNGNVMDGCEANLSSNPDNCNACGTKCNRSHGTASCNSGACGISCNPHFGDCNNDLSDGCEADLFNDKNNCNSCGNVCSSGGGTPACNSGVCGIACNPGLGDCDGNPGTGCETNLNTSLSNCGACGRVCSSNHASPSCSGGNCTLTCNTDYADCDGDKTNGCEVGLKTDPAHCGSCSKVCSSVNGTRGCSNGGCTIGCNSGWGDCDFNVDNGCEQNVSSDPLHCGSCTTACSTVNNAPTCSGGVCQVHCTSGYADCDSNPGNGCEVDTTANANHCGNCSTTCSTVPPATCVAGNLRTYTGPGTCATGTCSFGYTDAPCNTPPGPSCQGNVARNYSNPGSCSGSTCSYAYTDQTCNTPPSAACSGADVRRYWDAAGTCSGGSCNYTSHDQTCNAPPAAYCVSGTVRRAYSDSSTDCTGGSCTYAFADTTCGFQCAGGQCVNVECALPASNAWTPNPCVNDKPSWTGSPTCDQAMPIGRKAASTSPYFTRPNDDTCGTGDWDTSYTGCTTGNSDRGYRIFMRTGETAHITVNRLGRCWDGTAWGLVFKTHSGTVCPVGSCLDAGKCTCTNHVNCFTPSSFPWNYDFVAPADRWYVFVIDGADSLKATGDNGHYSLTIQLTCNQADCECP